MTNNLSSDILEQQFGPTELKILYQSDTTRIICTKSKLSGKLLELSFVTFIKTGVDKFDAVHREILDGKSMGKAFRDHGVKFMRETKAVYRNIFPDIISEDSDNKKYSTVVSVSVLVSTDKTPYAEILEAYSPEVRWP